MISIRFLSLLLPALLVASQAPSPRNSSLKIDVDLVLVNASVTNHDGQSVTGLDKSHFQVWEDKVQQDIEYFSAEEVPVSLGIVFDVSGSMADKIPVAREAVKRLLSAGNPEDEYTLIEFNDHAQVIQDFTPNISELQNRLAFVSSSGWTSFYDAVYLAMEKLQRGHNRKKALLLVTDGEDNHSRYTFENVKELAREADVQLYAIGMPGHPDVRLGSPPPMAAKISVSTRPTGQALLQQLVDLTGGQAFFTADVRKLDEICARISENLRSQYVIGYLPTNQSRDGKWRKLHVKVTDTSRVSVHAKSGYFGSTE